MSTTPTGLGLVRDVNTPVSMTPTIGNRAAAAARNNSAYGKFDQAPDSCYCGCCNMKKDAQ
jgi:hypothetical protein